MVDGYSVRGYPALVDEGATVGVRVYAAEADQLRAARNGTIRLLLLTLRSPAGYLRHDLGRDVMLTLNVSAHGTFSELIADGTRAAVDALLDWAGGPVWDAVAFASVRAKMAPHLDRATLDVLVAVAEILRVAQRVESALTGLRGGLLAASVIDVKTQLTGLLPTGFISRTGAARLPDLLRYLQALEIRLSRLAADPERDRAKMAEILPWEQRYREAVQALPAERRNDPDVRAVWWQLAEWRISLFAQPMKTTQPVSQQRIERAVAGLV
jgi:ATP-dependent helicase HrpA